MDQTSDSAPETSQDQEVIAGHNVSPALRPPSKQTKSKQAILCKFFAKHGCRKGDACQFEHAKEPPLFMTSESHAGPASSSLLSISDGSNTSPAELGVEVKANSPALAFPVRPSPRAAIARPIAPQQLANPRDYELNQLKRRFSPAVREIEGGTVLIFKLVPSDPDFPFEISELRISLSVPETYPGHTRPSIRVHNNEMERGFQINVERGFDDLVVKYPNKTLLALMNELDKNLETFLVSQKASTVKLVANTKKTPIKPEPALESRKPPANDAVVPSTKKTYTTEQLQDARSRLEADARRIEARMGRQPLYSKSSDGTYNIPLQVPKTGRLPVSLHSIKDVRLMVPQLYPLEPCNIRLREGSKEAELVEFAFNKHATEHPELTLMAHINYLVQNMHTMAQETAIAEVKGVVIPQTDQYSVAKEVTTQDDERQPRLLDQDRPHIQVIARPPEWLNATDSDDEDSDSSEYAISETDPEDEGGAELTTRNEGLTSGPERGILLSFPMLELYNIELLSISSLSLRIKCDRCKATTEIMNVKSTTSSGEISRIVESCKKCASTLSIAYRSEPMHMNSIRAGFIDLEGCTPDDLLPSQFQPTCSECSTTFAKPGVVSVRGETSMTICRECHKKMTFTLPEVKFLRVSSAERANRPLPRKKPKETLGIVAGTELPLKGRCKHYRKSYRWFRFSCCARVYSCDRCHDAAEEHPNEHANRMICGLCSKEQNYRPESCAFCHSSLVSKKTGGFWEGGKGTRDKTKMNRKDPRKYKRRGGGAISAKAK